MSKLVVNAPIQVKAISPEYGMGKTVPLFVADWLRTQDQADTNDIAYDLWNTVIASEQRGHSEESYLEHWQAVLQHNYESPVLAEWRDTTTEPEVVTDQNQQFGSWVLEIIDRSLALGDTQLEKANVMACIGCERVRAAENLSCTKPCSQCSEVEVQMVERLVLTTTFDEKAHRLAAASVGGRLNEPNHDMERAKLLSKQRLGGISLEGYGLSDDVFDPGVALGLLALHCASLADSDTVEMVASRSSLTHNLTGMFSVIRHQAHELPQLKMRPIAKAPVGYLMHLYQQSVLGRDDVSRALRVQLPPHLLKMRHDMSPETFDRVVF